MRLREKMEKAVNGGSGKEGVKMGKCGEHAGLTCWEVWEMGTDVIASRTSHSIILDAPFY